MWVDVVRPGSNGEERDDGLDRSLEINWYVRIKREASVK